MVFLGGFQITDIGWIAPHAVYADFTSSYAAGYLWQIYANRTLIGTTKRPGERRVIGQLVPSISPAPLTVVRVDSSDIYTDFGNELPKAAWNQFTLYWSSLGATNLDHWDILASPSAGGAATALIARVPYAGDGDYAFEAAPVPSSGTWNYAICPRDLAGNPGVLITTAVVVLLPPADVTPDVDGARFAVDATGGLCTVTFNY